MTRKKKPTASLVRSSAAEYLTFMAASGTGGVEAVYADENVWLSQKMMAQLYDVDVRTINYHLKTIFTDSELEEDAVIQGFRITAADGKTYDTKHYNLSAIIAVGYKVNSERAVQFQAIYQQLSADGRVVGLNEWTIMSAVYLDMIAHGVPDQARNGAEQLLDALNELRSVKAMLPRLGPTDTTHQVRERRPWGLRSAHLRLLQRGSPEDDGHGPFTRTEAVNRDTHSFDRTSTKPGYAQSALVADELVAHLNAQYRANPTGQVSLILENSARGEETLTFHHAHAGAAWTK
jgi:hypothetical protein